jgi:hypothetical protein
MGGRGGTCRDEKLELFDAEGGGIGCFVESGDRPDTWTRPPN